MSIFMYLMQNARISTFCPVPNACLVVMGHLLYLLLRIFGLIRTLVMPSRSNGKGENKVVEMAMMHGRNYHQRTKRCICSMKFLKRQYRYIMLSGLAGTASEMTKLTILEIE